MFLSNKYTKWYNAIVNAAKQRQPLINTYYEKHHIVPKSLGGTNSLSNLVLLTAREHFLCHLLLPKMLVDALKIKMDYALFCISIRSSYKINSRLFKTLKETHAKNVSIRCKGKKFTDAHKEKIALALKDKPKSKEHKQNMSIGGKTKIFSAEHRLNIGLAGKGKIAWNLGIPHTDEAKQRMSLSQRGENNYMYGKTHSKEAREAISKARTGKPRSDETKAKIGLASKGRIRTQESKDKQAKALRGKPQSKETIAKRANSRKENNRLKKLNALALFQEQITQTI